MSYPYRAVTVLCLVFSVLPFSHGVTEGDEEFDTQTVGNFYVFADQVRDSRTTLELSLRALWFQRHPLESIVYRGHAQYLLQVIHIINPSNLSIIGNITRDKLGAPLTNNVSLDCDSNTSRTWNDAVLVEVASNCQIVVEAHHVSSIAFCHLQNPSLGTRQVFVNEGDVYQYSNGSQYSFVSVIDTVSQKVSVATGVGPYATSNQE